MSLIDADGRAITSVVTEADMLGMTVEFMESRIAELELALEDSGWLRLTANHDREFSRSGLRRIIALCRLMFIKNPLIRRGVQVAGFYVWGQGVSIDAADEAVNDAVQTFIDDRGNQVELFGHQARLDKDHTLRNTGNVFLSLNPNRVTGDVQVRSIDVDEITEIIPNPEDRKEIWYYHRVWSEPTFDLVTGATTPTPREAWYPDWRYTPGTRPPEIGRHPCNWDQPIYHLKVGALEGMLYGVPETYAAIDWAKAYTSFLEDWATIARSISRFAWKATSTRGKATQVAQRLNSTITEGNNFRETNPSPVTGATFVHPDGGTDLTPINKAGVTLDAEGGKPLRLMVAAALNLPDTILSGDPEQGNLATAKTLDRPTELGFLERQQLWAQAYQDLADYRIDWAVKAPRGPLHGLVPSDSAAADGVDVELADETDRTITVTFPAILQDDILEELQAIQIADSTGYVPPETIARLMLTALGVDDIDEILEQLPELLAKKASAGAAAVAAFRAGQDPAALMRGKPDPTEPDVPAVKPEPGLQPDTKAPAPK